MNFRPPPRSTALERLDSHDVTDAELDEIFNFYDFAGRCLGGYGIVHRFLAGAAQRNAGPVTVLDLGCGRGDLARSIVEWAHDRGVEIRVHAADKYGRLVQMARDRHRGVPDVTFETRDLNDAFFLQAQQFDVVVSGMSLHRETDERARTFLKTANRLAKRGLIIVDWMRDPRALFWMGLLSRMGRSEVVRQDARVAVERGFRLAEAEALRKEAGMEWASVRAHFGYRFSISGERALSLGGQLSPIAGLAGT